MNATDRRTLALYSVSHAAVDAACAATLFSLDAPSLTLPILLYDLLAFSTQGLTGLFTDALGAKRRHLLVRLSLIITAAAFILAPMLHGGLIYLAVTAAGLGNSLFHVSAGAAVLDRSGEHASSLGIFVAPGAMGLTLGTLYPTVTGIVAVCALLAAAVTPKKHVVPDNTEPIRLKPVQLKTNTKIILAAMLLFAIFARSYAGFAVSFPWKTGAMTALILTAAVVLGKIAGGFAFDAVGGVKLTLISVPAAGLLLIFAAANMPLSLAAQFCVNLTMPLTLYLLYRLASDSPGFIFGLAASCLLPGLFFKNLLPNANGLALSVIIAAVFALNLVCLIVSSYFIKKGESHVQHT